MPEYAYFNLTLDTTAPSCTLTLGTNGYMNSRTGELGIACSDADVYQMKIWGIEASRSSNFTGDGTTTEFTVTSKPAEIDTVSVGGETTEDWLYDDTTGVVTLNSAPADSAAVLISYKEVLTESSATWENYSSTKNITVPAGDGSKTVYAKVRDDVYNESNAASVTVTLDLTAPTVAIISGPTPTKISKVSGKNVSEFAFQASEAFVEYKVMVVPNNDSTHLAGVQIPTTNGSTNTSGTGSFNASNAITVTINGADLELASNGDGVKIVKVFIKDNSNNWST